MTVKTSWTRLNECWSPPLLASALQLFLVHYNQIRTCFIIWSFLFMQAVAAEMKCNVTRLRDSKLSNWMVWPGPDGPVLTRHGRAGRAISDSGDWCQCLARRQVENTTAASITDSGSGPTHLHHLYISDQCDHGGRGVRYIRGQCLMVITFVFVHDIIDMWCRVATIGQHTPVTASIHW